VKAKGTNEFAEMLAVVDSVRKRKTKNNPLYGRGQSWGDVCAPKKMGGTNEAAREQKRGKSAKQILVMVLRKRKIPIKGVW